MYSFFLYQRIYFLYNQEVFLFSNNYKYTLFTHQPIRIHPRHILLNYCLQL